MKRVIFLVDMNAFFISCEMTRNPSLAGKPAAVAGDPKKRTGIILAANYEARKFGVKTTMVLREALRLCPQMILVPPDHLLYERKSCEVMAILSRYTPVIEQNSIDEAWLDMTGCKTLSGNPVDAASHIMDGIRSELGLWCSIGISENKFLAKMASEMKKPLGITELWREDIQTKLWPLPVRAMYGIGGKTAEKLNSIGIQTIGELACFNKEQLVKILGRYAADIHLYANGYDSAPVKAHSAGEMKSIGHSTTLAKDITDIEKAKTVIMELAEEVGTSARKHSKKGKTVQITIKYSDFHSITRQATIPATFSTKEIVHTGIRLLQQNWNSHLPVRLLGISLGGFEEESESNQLPLSGFEGNIINDAAISSVCDLDKAIRQKVRDEKIDKVIDIIRNKHGNSKITRAVLIKGNQITSLRESGRGRTPPD